MSFIGPLAAMQTRGYGDCYQRIEERNPDYKDKFKTALVILGTQRTARIKNKFLEKMRTGQPVGIHTMIEYIEHNKVMDIDYQWQAVLEKYRWRKF